MNLLVVVLVFGVILLAEIPDKSMIATLVLSTKFGGRWVALGACAAFAIHVAIAVTAGSLLRLLPHQLLDAVVGVLFALGALLLWRESRHDDEAEDANADAATPVSTRPWAAFGASFGVIFLSEWGDITQLALANMVAAYNAPWEVAIGGVLALWTAVLLGVTIGRTLLKRISAKLLHRAGTVIFAALAAISFVQAVR